VLHLSGPRQLYITYAFSYETADVKIMAFVVTLSRLKKKGEETASAKEVSPSFRYVIISGVY